MPRLRGGTPEFFARQRRETMHNRAAIKMKTDRE